MIGRRSSISPWVRPVGGFLSHEVVSTQPQKDGSWSMESFFPIILPFPGPTWSRLFIGTPHFMFNMAMFVSYNNEKKARGNAILVWFRHGFHPATVWCLNKLNLYNSMSLVGLQKCPGVLMFRDRICEQYPTSNYCVRHGHDPGMNRDASVI